MRRSNLSATAFLFLTAVLWGLSYSAQAEAMKTMTPLMFVFLRYLLGSLVLLPVIFFWKSTPGEIVFPDRKLFTGGVLCGICLAGGEILQQFGLLYTSAGKAGFLTALYVIMIPVIGCLAGKKSNWQIWSSSLLSAGGAYLLCSDGTLGSIGNRGDLLMLLCALCFAFQFIAIAEFAPRTNALQLAAVQFLTVAVVSGAAALVFGERCSYENVVSTAGPLLFCGVIAIGFACTVQVVTQKYVHPAAASIILSTASVFAVLWGWALLNEKYSLINLLGCAMIFAAALWVQLPAKEKAQIKKENNGQ